MRSRDPMARDLFSPKYAPRVVPSKKQKAADRAANPKHKKKMVDD